MRFNYPLILHTLGTLVVFIGLLMLLCVPVAINYWEEDWLALIISSMAAVIPGLIMRYSTRNNSNKELKKRDGYLIVTLAWVFMSAFGALPYVLSGAIPSYTDAFFETISGFTTTGASILNDIEGMPHGLLFWRSLTQWVGGMGIIVLAVAILPILGIGGMQLFVAEAPGISPDKLQPRIRETAKRLWFLYLGLTIIETGLLMIGGMDLFDATNHALTTMATGGFSTYQASMAEQSAYIQYVVIVFMFLAGTSFSLIYYSVKLQFRKVWAFEEFRYYMGFTVLFTLIVTLGIFFSTEETDVEKAFRDALFQVVSIITTTGFATADYTSWTPFITVLFFILMFIGGSAGSTAGGVKVVRYVVLIKNSVLELKRQLHPSAVIPVRLNDKAVPRDITFNILAFIMIYIFIFATGSLTLAASGVDFTTAIGAVATSLGNIGPGLGQVGPVDNFANVPTSGKWILSFLMLLGRLELFTVLILFTPYFWRRQ